MKFKKTSILCLLVCLVVLSITSCGSSGSDVEPESDYRQLMREFVENISSYAKGLDVDFIIIPQNGHALLTNDGDSTGEVNAVYMAAIDGVGREDLFYGYDEDNVATPSSEKDEMIAFMNLAEDNNVEVLVTDYCSTESYMDDSYQQSADLGYISFAADQRELNNIPPYPVTPYNVNSSIIASLVEVKNFLYLLNNDSYSTKAEFIDAISATNYDLVIMDLYFQASEKLTASDLATLKVKANGGQRLVIAYMSIGEAEDYRYYWESDWSANPPSWLKAENEDWPGNYKVEYWNSEWQAIIYGNNSSYLKYIIDAGFDGVYLDIIDAYEYFEG